MPYHTLAPPPPPPPRPPGDPPPPHPPPPKATTPPPPPPPGKIPASRHRSYVRLYDELKDLRDWQHK